MAGQKVSKKVSTINRRTTRLLYLCYVKMICMVIKRVFTLSDKSKWINFITNLELLPL